MNNRVIGLFAVAAFIAIVPPTIWKDHTEDHWVEWIYDYQPLIAGAFAIFAAYLTINTMRETDDRQELRHQELMRLNLRRDQLIARRAAHPQSLEIQDCREEISNVVLFLRDTRYNEWITSVVVTRFTPFALLVAELEDVLFRDQFDEVKPLLDQSGYRALQITRKELEYLKAQSDQFTVDVINWRNGTGFLPSMDEADRKHYGIQQRLKLINHHLGLLNESIVTLAGEYE